MQSFSTLFQSTREHLGSLSANTKLFIGSIVVILAMALFLVSLYAGQSSMSPLPISLTSESRSQAVQFLATTGVDWKEQGGVILVPMADRDRLVSQLNEQNIISPDQIDFDSMVNDESLFLTKGQYRTRTRVATQNVLGRMIAQMHNVRSATVVISGEEDAVGLGRAFIPRTASVTVLTNGEAIDPQGVDAIARMVAGATHGLKTESVAVIDARTGRSFAARGDDALAVSRNMDIKLAAEKHAKRTLEEALGYIPGVRISVNAVVDTREIVRETTSYDEPKQGLTSESFEESINSGSSHGGEPGIRANTGVRITTPQRSPGRSTSSTREKSSQVPAFGGSNSRILDAGGYALQINASVGVPRTYLAGLYATKYGDGQMDDGIFDELVETTLEDIKVQVAPLVDTSAVEGGQLGGVTIAMVTELRAASMAGPAAEETGWSVAATDGAAVRNIGLGSLAVLSLGLMFLMLRRAGSSPVAEQIDMSDGAVHMPGADVEVVDDVEDTQVVLEGVEIDDEAVRRSVMLDQIRASVESNPDEVAHVLRRWVRTEA
ncbi:MAG: hypothetical protein MK095_01715 [Phycisphaerales bacterium]|nr:hypothetical protein [Phycisphaerales bacterium]